MSKLHRNAIITGCIDHYCLVCDVYFLHKEDAESHSEKATHRRKLEKVGYFDNYHDDNIRRVRQGFFCEYCNMLLPNAAQLALHCKESKHVDNKGMQSVTRSGDKIVFRDVVIDDDAWNGLIETTCVVCNIKFDDIAEHKEEQMHLLNLVQINLMFADEGLYRKIDGSAVHCLTCNTVVSRDSTTDHFASDDHKDLYKKCLKTTVKRNEQHDTSKGSEQHDDDVSQIMDSHENFQKDDELVYLLMKTVDCRECSENPELNNDFIKRHIREHKKKQVEVKVSIASDGDDKTRDTKKFYTDPVHLTNNSDVESVMQNRNTTGSRLDGHIYKIAKENQLTIDRSNKKAHCGICEQSVPAKLKDLKHHLESKKHKDKTSKELLKIASIFKHIFEDFAFTITVIEYGFGKDVVINDKYCINDYSFYVIPLADFTGKCVLCDMNFSIKDVIKHVKDARHLTKMVNVLVVFNELLESEFIREIKPNMFHCSYCNIIVFDWDSMLEHLETTIHRENKILALRRLEGHLPSVKALREEGI